MPGQKNREPARPAAAPGVASRRYALALGFLVLLALLSFAAQPVPSLSAEPVSTLAAELVVATPAADLAAAVVYTVDKCPPSFQKSVYNQTEVVYLHGTGFAPYEPIYWDIWGMPGSCDADKRIAHSRMTASWNGSFCIYSYTVAGDDCGTYKVVVNGAFVTYYDVPRSLGPTATATGTATLTPTVTPTFPPTPYTFTGYVYEELRDSGGASPAATAPLSGVQMELYTGRGESWTLVDRATTTQSGWFALDHVTELESPRFRIVEIDPPGYESVRAVRPPLYGIVVDPNTIEMRMPYGEQAGALSFYDRVADATPWPTATPTVTGTPPTETPTLTPIPQDEIKTVVLQQGLDGYTGVEDTYITSWFLYENYARYNMMSVRSDDRMSPMLRFDLSFIPPNSTIIDATLSLYVPSAGPHPMRVEAYRVYRPWVVSEVNWIEASKKYKWAEWGANKLGQDRAEAAEDGVDLTAVGRWYDLKVTRMAQEWVNAEGQNQGVILKGSAESVSVQWNYYASEYWQTAYRPKLTVVYALGPATPTPTPTRRATATPTDTATPTPTWYIPFGGTR